MQYTKPIVLTTINASGAIMGQDKLGTVFANLIEFRTPTPAYEADE
jgi:hypothetical protein